MRAVALSSWMANIFKQHASKIALTFLRKGRVETILTYAQLETQVALFTGMLGDKGIGNGDHVILFLDKSVDAVIAHLSIQRIGAVSIPLNPGFKASEMQYLLSDARPRLVLCNKGKADWIRRIDAGMQIVELPTQSPYAMRDGVTRNVSEENSFGITTRDPALIIYTSGTTGAPKGAVLTQYNLVHDAGNIMDIWEISQNDVLCHALPLFHVHGLCFALHTALLSGAHVVMLDRFDADAVLDALTTQDIGRACTVFMAVPAMYAKLMDRLDAMQAAPDFSHIRLLTSGSAPLLPKEFERIKALFGQEPVEREGMSETGMNFSNPLHGKRVPGSIGLPLPGLQVRIVDPQTFDDVDRGATGEIWLKGPAITRGYWHKPEETRSAFEDGWFRTGDLGRKDQDGYYYLTDRIKHIIITGGENVSAKEVETVINSIEGVVESSVVGVPDPQWGERVVAAVCVRPKARLDTASIRAFCKARLHDWKCPKEIEFIEAMPRNTMGKVLKEKVKKIFTP